ncbi:MAG: hypothetical protein GC168_17005 [Candidatus Hydrogenedens sp.]|nr:hypothetical protein [Candidatus Hydrogenedens sp.]
MAKQVHKTILIPQLQLRRHAVWWLLALLISSIQVADAAPDGFDALNCNDLPLLRECLEQQDAARQSIQGFRLTLEWQQSGPLAEGGDKPLHVSAGGTCELIGFDSLRMKSASSTTTAQPNGLEQTLTETSVIGSGFFVYGVQRSGQKGTAQQFDFKNISDLDERAAALADATMGQDVLRYGFGDGVTTLERHLEMHQDVNRWFIERQADGLIRLSRYSPATSDPDLSDCEWYIDPARGGLIVRTVNRDFDGSVLSDLKVETEEVSPGLWFPTGFARRGEGSMTKARFTQVQVNPELSLEDFGWQVFGNRLEGYRGFRKALDGQISSFVVENGLPVARSPQALVGDTSRDSAKS